MKYTGTLLLTLCTSLAFADDNCQLIDGIVSEQLSLARKTDDYDRINKSNIITESVLKQYARNKNSVNCDFKQSKEYMRLVSSSDNKFRVFSWDDMTGGTMRYYDGFMQVVDDKGDVLITKLDSGVKSVFSTKIDGKPTYLLVTYFIGDSRARGQTITLYQAVDGKLISPKLFKTSKMTNEISFGYEQFSVSDADRKDALVQFDTKTQTLRFPVVVDDPQYTYGKVTNKWIQYKVNGKQFERVKN